jgi:hypothetical protein
VFANFAIDEHPILRQSSGIALIIISSVLLYISPIHGTTATIVFLTIGPIAMTSMWTRDRVRLDSPARSITFASKIWGILFLLTCVWELGSYILSYRVHDDFAYPTISILLGPLLKTSAGKAIFLLIWIGIGMQLLRLWRRK